MRVTTKGQVTIPKEIRDRLGIGPGSEVEFVDENATVVLRKTDGGVPESRADFDAWAARVAGTITAADLMGMDGKQYINWLRGPRDDLDAD
jgi:AbrB family looped-hinge helix DNA binding protein